METISYKCPNCGANVEYDAESNLLFCAKCGQFYQPGEVVPGGAVYSEPVKQSWHEESEENQTKNQAASFGYEQPEEVQPHAVKYMEVNIFHCSSCGAQIMSNDVEVSKNCAFCGQSAIIFDRVSKEQKPDKILPFKITKEDAIERVKKRFSKAKCMPDDINNISVNSVYGIYMPYWIFDSTMEMGLMVAIRGDNGNRQYNFQDTMDMDVCLDASRRLNDGVSLMLNPFPTENLVDFDAGYLSGFYADRFDVPFEERKKDAVEVIGKALEDELYSQIPDKPQANMAEMYGDAYKKLESMSVKKDRYGEKYTLNDVNYALLPVYFITFRIGNKLINILVNGATGKPVGSVPIDESKFKKVQTRNMIIAAVVWGIIGAGAFRYFPLIGGIMFFAIVLFFSISAGLVAKKKFEKNQRETNSASMFSLSRNRDVDAAGRDKLWK